MAATTTSPGVRDVLALSGGNVHVHHDHHWHPDDDQREDEGHHHGVGAADGAVGDTVAGEAIGAWDTCWSQRKH